MADITFNCPHCNQSLEAPEEMRGQNIECPACQRDITIQAAKSPLPPIPPRQAELPARKPFLPPQKNSSQDIPKPLPPPARKGCPYCSSLLNGDTVICINCGRNLKTGQIIQTKFSANSIGHPDRSVKSGKIPWIIIAALLSIVGVYFTYSNFIANGGKKSSLSSFFDGKGDDQFYDYIKVKANNAKSIKEKNEMLSSYVEKYPNGKHSGEVKALLEQAQAELSQFEEEQKLGKLIVNAQVTLGSGQTIPVKGWIQLIDIDKNSLRLTSEIVTNDVEIKKLKEDRSSCVSMGSTNTTTFDSLIMRKKGDIIHNNLKGKVVVQTNMSDGKIVFEKINPGTYLVYGAGLAGMNAVTYFEIVDIKAGMTMTTDKISSSVFNASFSIDTWILLNSQ